VLFCLSFSGCSKGAVPEAITGSREEGAVSVRLFIGNLPYTASEAELREHLSSVGEPAQIVLPTDRETGRPRGFAFVDYVDRGVAEEAIRRYNQQPFKGRPLAVSEARPREDRPPGPRPGGFSGPRPTGPGGFSGGGGGFGAPRPGGFSRPPDAGAGAPRGRNFGPDAPPKNKRKPPRKDDRGPKGPIKARPVTTLYDEDEDWRAKDEEPLGIDDIATSKPGAADIDVDLDEDKKDVEVDVEKGDKEKGE
jgi:RNA recognition motif-containing protein